MEYIVFVISVVCVAWYLASKRTDELQDDSLEDILTSYVGDFELIWVKDALGFQNMIQDLLTYEYVSLDTETAVKNERKLNLLMLARMERVYVVDPLVSEINLLLLQPVFDSCTLIFHNAPFDIKIIEKCGLSVKLYFDTLVLSKQLKNTVGHSLQNLPRSNGLKECAQHFLGISIPQMTLEEHDEWHLRPLTKKQMHYSALDAEITLRLAKIFSVQIEQAEPFGTKRNIERHEWEALQNIRKSVSSHIHPLRIFCTVQKTQIKFFVDSPTHVFAKIKNQKSGPLLCIGNIQPTPLSDTSIPQHANELIDAIHNT